MQGGCGNRIFRKGIEHAQLIQLSHRMGQQIDANPQGLEGAHAFKNIAFDSALVQHQSQGQAAYARADDNDFQVWSPYFVMYHNNLPGINTYKDLPGFLIFIKARIVCARHMR